MPRDTISSLIGILKDKKSLEIKEKVEKIAGLNTNLLVYGETGTGKDVWVEYLHSLGPYEKMINLNCGDVPENLLESEWFGYRKGAFTGADRDYQGRWQAASGGTLFLNQVDLLGINLQSKLLRIIERKKYFPLGSNREIDIDARFVFAADHDIEQKVRDGLFRQDLFYRIASYSIFIPPLRERKQDILPLLTHFARKKGLAVNLDSSSLRSLADYPWNGNIRELESFVTNVSILSREINRDHVDALLKDSRGFLEVTAGREMTMAELEQEYIRFLLKKYRNKKKVAEILGISRKSLYNKLNK